MKSKLSVQIISSLLVLLFTYTAISKLITYSNFKFQLGRSPYITSIEWMVAPAIPAIELTAAIFLVINFTRLAGLYISFFLMLTFTGYIYLMLHYSPFLPCSCGGVIAAMTWHQHLYFNIFFLLLSLAGILLTIEKGGTGSTAGAKTIVI